MKCVLKDLIAVSKDGEWGKGEPFNESVEMLAIRGTDFEDVRFGLTVHIPRRYIERRHAERKQLQPWDLLIEAAGGTKDQITGRTVLQARSAVRLTIERTLEELPKAYTDDLYNLKCELAYRHVYDCYAGESTSVYTLSPA
jgi:hypothetical protein